MTTIKVNNQVITIANKSTESFNIDKESLALESLALNIEKSIEALNIVSNIKAMESFGYKSTEGVGENIKAGIKNVWEKIKQFFINLGKWCKNVAKFIKDKIKSVFNKKDKPMMSKSDINKFLIEFKDISDNGKKSKESDDDYVDPNVRINPNARINSNSKTNTDDDYVNPNARIDTNAIAKRMTLIMEQIKSIIYLCQLERIGANDTSDANKIKSNIQNIITYINSGKTETDLNKLSDNFTRLEDLLKTLNVSKYDDEVAEKVKKQINNKLNFDPDERITEATGDANSIINGLQKMTNEWWDEIVNNYNKSKTILNTEIDKLSKATSDLENYANDMLKTVQSQHESNSDLALAQKKVQYATLCRQIVNAYIKQFGNMLAIADKAAKTNENMIAIKNMILAAVAEKEKHDREVKLRDGPRVM